MHNDATPTIRIVIPCYNHGHFLADALDSISKQTFGNFEVVIVNDGSTDPETIKILRAIDRQGIHRVIHQTNRGLPAARNAGIASARSQFIVTLDSDDRIAPEFLEKCLSVLLRNPRFGFAYTGMVHFGREEGRMPFNEYDFYRLLFENICNSCSMFKKSAWEAVGGFDETMKDGYEDWDFWIRLGENGYHGMLIREYLFFYRKRKSSMLLDAQKKDWQLYRQIVRNHSAIYTSDRLARIRNEWGHGNLAIGINVLDTIPPIARNILLRMNKKLIRERLTSPGTWMRHPASSFMKILPSHLFQKSDI